MLLGTKRKLVLFDDEKLQQDAEITKQYFILKSTNKLCEKVKLQLKAKKM